MSAPTDWLEKFLAKDEELAAAVARTAELESRLRGVLNHEPESATRAMMWMGRTRNAETLLIELAEWVERNPSLKDLLPTGFHTRLRVQLMNVEMMRRDQVQLGESPPDDEWWETFAGDILRTGRGD